MVDGLPDVLHEGLDGERAGLVQFLVEVGEVECVVGRHVLVEDDGEDGQRGEERGVADHEVAVVDGDGRVVEGQAEAELHHGDQHAAVDDELRERAGAVVAEAAVPEEQVLEVLELRDAEVRGERGLLALLAEDADAHVRLLDHRHVVAAVADRERQRLRFVLHDAHDLRLLRGRAAADHDGRRLLRDPDEDLLRLRVADDGLEQVALDHQHVFVDVQFALDQVVVQVSGEPNVPRLEVTREHDEVLFRVLQVRGAGNALGSFDFVPSQHPHFHPCLFER